MSNNLPHLQGGTQKFFMARMDGDKIYCVLSGLDNANNYYWQSYPVKISVNSFALAGNALSNCLLVDQTEGDNSSVDSNNNLIIKPGTSGSFAIKESNYQPLGFSNNIGNVASSVTYGIYSVGSNVPCNIISFYY